MVYLCGTPTWRPQNSVIIFNLLWLSKRLIVCSKETVIYIRTFPNTSCCWPVTTARIIFICSECFGFTRGRCILLCDSDMIYDVMKCGVMWYDILWYYIWCNVVWRNVIRYEMLWYSKMWYMMWCNVMWHMVMTYGVLWYDMV